jgi:hypothetical protein
MSAMNEDEPLKGAAEIGATRVPLKGPNVISTLDTPPRADAVKAHDAAMRKHLQDHRAQQDQGEQK